MQAPSTAQELSSDAEEDVPAAEDEASPDSIIRIKLKSYWVDLIQNAADKIVKAAEEIKRWTVLRSPHVDKDSRETFEQRTHKRLVDIHGASPATMDRLMSVDVPAGVGIDVRILE
ncbi:hypothetical protein QBZ16_003795 [Prototheca wickerhamii]|uniref:Small ribosomal subunit protein uS10 domain-containing protein n=1 Tax=Prototheca wickerhamii TaxID=3111 RepID=A0AAD9MI70_PROWI|nr:hypothetical protein QBZ16_003795 [Prototheca wickerhamii]